MAIGPFISREPDYVDLDLNFFANPTTKDIMKKRGDEAIKRSIQNLIQTNHYERPFRSYIGSGIRKLLFDNMTPLTAVLLKDAIEQVINNFEKRVQVVEVLVTPDYDSNGFNVRLQYVIKNREQPVVTSFFLERIR